MKYISTSYTLKLLYLKVKTPPQVSIKGPFPTKTRLIRTKGWVGKHRLGHMFIEIKDLLINVLSPQMKNEIRQPTHDRYKLQDSIR